MNAHFDCEIAVSEDTLRRGIAGFKAKIVGREPARAGEGPKVIVKVWDDFESYWSEPQRVRPEEVKEL